MMLFYTLKIALSICKAAGGFAALLPAFAQGTAPVPSAGKLLITGSFTMAPMVEGWAKW